MTKAWIGPDGLWDTAIYQSYKTENFQLLDSTLGVPPKKILDIGCGLAWESRMFNEKYNTELWLLDGDTSANELKPIGSTSGSYHDSPEDFLFYHPLSQLDTELKKLGTKNYNLVDCNNIDIPEDVKFDVITSWLSCGFHYPVNTYRDLILKHSHSGTRIFMDLRIRYRKTGMPKEEPGVEIVKKINQRNKYMLCEIKFL